MGIAGFLPAIKSASSCAVASPGADQGQLVGSGGAKTRPRTLDGERRQHGQILGGALQHPGEYVVIHFPALDAILARRTDQQLAVGLWLHVKGYGIRGCDMSAFQVSELDYLVAQNARPGFGDGQVAFAPGDGESWREVRSPFPCRVDENGGAKLVSVGEQHATGAHGFDLLLKQLYPGGQRLLQQENGDYPGRHNRVFVYHQSPGKPTAQGRLNPGEGLCVEHLARDAVLLIDTVFATNLLHLLIVRSHPEGAARGVFRCRR
jgi:hypothetical protein